MNNIFTKILIAVEDRRFYNHWGIDPMSICRAIVANFYEKRYSQGGSTITQQLARTLYLHNKKTIARKIKEAVIALYLEIRYTKKEILHKYMTEIYMGQDKKNRPIKGIYRASKHYFDKPLDELSVAETAAMVAMIKGPNFYKLPSSQGTARRIAVLCKMLDINLITTEEFFEASRVSF